MSKDIELIHQTYQEKLYFTVSTGFPLNREK